MIRRSVSPPEMNAPRAFLNNVCQSNYVFHKVAVLKSSTLGECLLLDLEGCRLVPADLEPVRVENPGAFAAVALGIVLVDRVRFRGFGRNSSDDEEGVVVGNVGRPVHDLREWSA